MLRLAAIFTHQAGGSIVAMVHDALLVESKFDDIEHVVSQTRAAMQRASELVLAGFPLRTEVQIIKYPDRFREERGSTMWEWMIEALPVVKKSRTA
jgi:hypothetical protein